MRWFQGRSSEFRLSAAALIFFAGLALLILHPMLFNSGTKVAGFDFFNYNWNFWWIRHVLTTPGLNLYENNFAMFPFTTNYGYHALAALWFPVWALLEPLIGTLNAVNLIIVIGCTLNGWLTFVLLRREGVAPGLALIGGAALQASPITRYFYYNTHLNLMDWFWLPAQLLLWQQIVRNVEAGKLRRALVWAVVQGVTLWGVLQTDLQFPIFTAFLLAPYVLFTLWRSCKRFRLLGAGIVVAVVAAPLAWFLGPLPYILRFSGTLAAGTVEDRPGIPLNGFLTMSDQWWYWGSPSLGAFVTVVVIVSLLGGLFLRRKRPAWRWLWFALALPPLILSLGPNLTIGDQTIPMLPFRLLYEQTNGMFRMPWRLAPIFILAALIFVGKTWTPCFRRMGAGRVFALAGIFLLLAADVRLFESAPLDAAPTDYQFYHQIGAETGEPYDDYVVLEVPNGASTGELIVGDPRASQLQFYGMTHEKRMVNGFISRAPLENYWYMLIDDPLFSWLGQRRFLEPEAVEAQLRQRIYEYPIGYVVVHRDLIGRESSTVQEILGYFNSLDDLLCPYTVEGDAVVYRTRWHPDGCAPRTPPETSPGVYTIDVGSPGDEGFLGWGWHYAEPVGGLTLRWTGNASDAGETPQTQVYVDLPPGGYTVTLSAQAYYETRQLRLRVNDLPLDAVASVTVDALHEYDYTIPAEMLGDGKRVKLTLAYDNWVVPAEVGQGVDTRRLAVAVDWIRFTRKAAEQ
ncbi:MAG: hypothetical protein ABI835_08280 [Chloroflexota bacterium]